MPKERWGAQHTVKPLLRVVDSVLEPYVTGVARPLVKGEFLVLTALMAARERAAVCRLRASRREAIACGRVGRGGLRGWAMGRDGVDEVLGALVCLAK